MMKFQMFMFFVMRFKYNYFVLCMASSCGRAFLYFYNLILLGISGVVLYVSVLFVWTWGNYCTIAADTYTIVPAGVIFLCGLVILVTGVVGFCGTKNKSRCTLAVMFSLLLVMLSLEIVGSVLIYVKKDEIDAGLNNNLWKSFYAFYAQRSYSKLMFDQMQTKLECCGVNGPDDWSVGQIPDSCCEHLGMNCSNLPENVYKEGCYVSLLSLFNHRLKYILGIVMGFAVFQIFGMIMIVYVMTVLKRRSYSRLFSSPLPIM